MNTMVGTEVAFNLIAKAINFKDENELVSC